MFVHKLFIQRHHSFPWLGDEAGYDVGLSYRPASLCNLARVGTTARRNSRLLTPCQGGGGGGVAAVGGKK